MNAAHLNAALIDAAPMIAAAAGTVAVTILATRPGARRHMRRWARSAAAITGARIRPWNGTTDDAITPADDDRWDDAASIIAEVERDAPAREMGVYISDRDEAMLAELAGTAWPNGEYSAIVLREKRLWRRAARAMRRRAVRA